MVKTIALAGILASAQCAFGLQYICGFAQDGEGEHNLKFSTSPWTSEWSFKVPALPTKPGVNDSVAVRGGYTIDLDKNLEIRSLHINGNGIFIAKGKNIKVKTAMTMTLPGERSDQSGYIFDKSSVEIGGGGIVFETYKYSKSFGHGRVSLKNSKLTTKGGIVFMFSSNEAKQSTPGGLEFNLEGNSSLTFGGECLLDEVLRLNPESWNFIIRITPEDGKYPLMTFSNKADLIAPLVYVKVPENAKTGKFPLIDMVNARSTLGAKARFFINSNSVKIGQSTKVGARKVTLLDSGAGRDSKTKNDLLLVIE